MKSRVLNKDRVDFVKIFVLLRENERECNSKMDVTHLLLVFPLLREILAII